MSTARVELGARWWPGRPGARTLVLLHGWLGEAGDWDAVVRALDGRFGVLAYDLPGHGDTVWPAAVALDIPALASHLAADLARRRVDRCVVAGYSMGGRVALALAMGEPAVCDGLVLVSTHPGIEDPIERAARVDTDARRAHELVIDPTAFLAAWYRQPIFATLADAVDLDALVARRAARDVSGLARALVAFGTGADAPRWAALPALGQPALVVAGAADTRYVAVARQTADRLPDAALCVIPGASHAVHLEDPGAVALAIRNRFLAPFSG